jgi:AraC family transcriptional activator of tynA and feaB
MKSWNTSTLPAERQFGYWREVLCEAFTALTSAAHSPRHFSSTVVLHELAETNAAELVSFAQEIVRGWEEIHRRADEFYFVNLQLQGVCKVEQDGRRIEVRPGSFYLVDTTRPYRLNFAEDFRTLSFRIPQHQLAARLRQPRRATAVAVSEGSSLGSLAVAQMQGLMQCAPQLGPEAAMRLSATLAELIALAVTGSMPSDAQARQEVRRVFRESIVHHVESHAADPAISVESVARRFRVSPRYVHGVFAEQALSFAQLVLERRLSAAAGALDGSTASVASVAAACGFGDVSYFGRAFRRRFDCSPTEWRQRGSASN